MSKTITGIVAWLKGWFYDKDEITSKEQALQTQINNKASTSDLNTTNGNVTNLSNSKADKNGGVGQITDTVAHSNLGTAAGAKQSDINIAIDNKIGALNSVEFVRTVTTRPTASADTMNAIYVVTGNSSSTGSAYAMYVTVKNGNDYSWEKVDDADLKGFVTNSELTTALSSKANLNDVYTKDEVYTKTEANNLNCGTFEELQTLIDNTSSGGILILEKDYKNTTNASQININKSMTIVGNNHVIDANGKGKCFYVSVAYVSIYGLNFVNGKYDGNGCAVYGNTTGLYVIDCTFTNNIGNNSSALFFYGNNSYAINCIFKNNVTAINSTGRDDIIHDCVFINNSYAINRSVNSLPYSFKGNKFLSPASNVKDRLINCTSLDYSTTNHTHSGYAASTHNHAISDITDLQTNLDSKLSNGDAVTNIALVPKSENSTGAIRLYYGDES